MLPLRACARHLPEAPLADEPDAAWWIHRCAVSHSQAEDCFLMNPKVAEIVRTGLGLRDAWRVNEVRGMLDDEAPGHDLDNTELEVLWRDYSEKSSASWIDPDEDAIRLFVSTYDLRGSPGLRMR